MENRDKLLELKDLRTSFRIGREYFAAVDGVDLTINKNETFAIVGESGCGKSAMALSITRLHNPNFTMMEGEVNFKENNLLSLTEKELNKVRGNEISMIFQDPLTSLNPLFKVGPQIEESLKFHTNFSKSEMMERALLLLNDVGMLDPRHTYNSFPHELSGGMRQRVMIAIALACEPSLIVADEPTTALDVTIQAQILGILRKLQNKKKTSIILITHDLGVVAEIADRVAVMYAGQVVELAPCKTLFKNPLHPYTQSLFSSIPSTSTSANRLQTIQGTVPSLKNLPRTGCRFSLRIPWITHDSHDENPQLNEVAQGHFVRCSCYKEFHFNNMGEEG